MSNSINSMRKDQRKKYYSVYIATNKCHNVFYTGVTNNIFRREWQHKCKLSSNSFTAQYNVNKVFFYESYGDVWAAINREKEIKGWTRAKKIALIINTNPNWKNLIIESLR
jgi:putative endonuclease